MRPRRGGAGEAILGAARRAGTPGAREDSEGGREMEAALDGSPHREDGDAHPGGPLPGCSRRETAASGGGTATFGGRPLASRGTFATFGPPVPTCRGEPRYPPGTGPPFRGAVGRWRGEKRAFRGGDLASRVTDRASKGTIDRWRGLDLASKGGDLAWRVSVRASEGAVRQFRGRSLAFKGTDRASRVFALASKGGGLASRVSSRMPPHLRRRFLFPSSRNRAPKRRDICKSWLCSRYGQ